MSNSKRVLLNSGYLYGKMIISLFISLYTTRIILEVLGSSDFGLYNLIAGITMMLAFINVTLTSSTQRFMSIAQGENKFEKQISIFNVSLIIHIVAAIIIVGVLFISSFFIFNGFLNIDPNKIHSAKIVFYIVITITMLNIISVPFEAAINAHEDMLYFSIIGLVETVLKFTSALLLMVIMFDKLIVYSFALLIIAFVLIICKVLYVLKKYPESIINPLQYFDKNIYKEMISFSSWGFLTSTISIFTSNGQNILINIFFGTRVNAAQGVSGQVIGQVGSVTNVLLKALNPVIYKSSGANDKVLFLQSIKSGSKLAFLSFSIIGIPVIFEMEYIFKLWLKEVPDFTIVFCTISMIGFILGQLTITIESAIFATGRIKNFTIVKSITDIIPFLFVYVFFKLGYPPYSMYVIALIFEIVRQSIVLYYGSKLCNIDIKDFIIGNIIKPIGISVIAILSIILIQMIFSPSIFRVLITSGFSAVLTLLLYYFIGFSKKEQTIIDSIFFSIKEKINYYSIKTK